MSKRAPNKQLDRFSRDDDEDSSQEPMQRQQFQFGNADWKANPQELATRSISIPKTKASVSTNSKVNPFASVSFGISSAAPAIDFTKKRHGLNKSFISYVNEQYSKNPCVDLRGAFERYSSHLASIEKQQQSDEKMNGIEDSSKEKEQEKTTEKPSEKPTFSFEKTIEKPAFSFQKPAIVQEKSIEKPAFSFENPSNKPTFSFENPSNKPTFSFENPSNKPTFSFENPIQKPIASSNSSNETQKPIFTFQFNQEKSSSNAAEQQTSPFKAPTFNLFANASSGFSFQSQPPQNSASKEVEEQDDDAEEFVEDGPKEHFEVIKLPEEEGKEILLDKRCKLFLFKDNEYKEKGVSEVRLLLDSTSQKHILVARMEVSGSITLNSILNNVCKATAPSPGKKDVIVLCFDANGKLSNHLLRFKSFEEAQEVYEKISAVIQ